MRTGTNHPFIPGPTNVPETVRRAMNVAMQDQRGPEFGALTLGILADLKRVFRTETARVILFPGSGTGCLGSRDHQHAEPRRQGPDGAARPVLHPLGRNGDPPWA